MALAKAFWRMTMWNPSALVRAIACGLKAGFAFMAMISTAGTTSPVEAALTWAIQKVRRKGGDREGGFPGADRILDELENGASRTRVGLAPRGPRADARRHTAFRRRRGRRRKSGHVTSGAFGPTIEGPMSMGYVSSDLAAEAHNYSGSARQTPAGDSRGDALYPANFKR